MTHKKVITSLENPERLIPVSMVIYRTDGFAVFMPYLRAVLYGHALI